jgi:hypothetical protein
MLAGTDLQFCVYCDLARADFVWEDDFAVSLYGRFCMGAVVWVKRREAEEFCMGGGSDSLLLWGG